jgi:hypothetical protein
VGVLKALNGVEWRAVIFAEAFDEFEAQADSVDHLLQAVSFDVQAAAPQFAVFGKRREYKMTTRF